MKPVMKIGLTACAVLAVAGAAFGPQAWNGARAQGASMAQPTNTPKAWTTDAEGPSPDPTHIPFVLPKDIKWGGRAGAQETATLYGDPSKEGPYAVLYRWYPGNFSRPHFHDKPRWIYVVSGTWWVSSSNVYDEKSTHPMHAGTFVTDMPNTVHFDGARCGEKEPAVILLAGIGPVSTVQVGTDGKPMAAGGRGGGGGRGAAAAGGAAAAAPAPLCPATR